MIGKQWLHNQVFIILIIIFININVIIIIISILIMLIKKFSKHFRMLTLLDISTAKINNFWPSALLNSRKKTSPLGLHALKKKKFYGKKKKKKKKF